jgi:hypothetical protein
MTEARRRANQLRIASIRYDTLDERRPIQSGHLVQICMILGQGVVGLVRGGLAAEQPLTAIRYFLSSAAGQFLPAEHRVGVAGTQFLLPDLQCALEHRARPNGVPLLAQYRSEGVKGLRREVAWP